MVVNAGTSAGSADYTVRIVGELGEVLVHGVLYAVGQPTPPLAIFHYACPDFKGIPWDHSADSFY
ncbi:MAG: hypothetical protein GX087_09795 [Desulfobulbaceae bacterium]|nr:hypothetical protein [Desulfobulbaceae bacterium]